MTLSPITFINRLVVQGTTGDDTFNFSVNQYGMPIFTPYGVEYHSNGGNDNVVGTWHDDIFVLNSGAETINGNGGTDGVDYSGSTAGVVVNLNQTTQHGGWAEGDQLTNIENVTGSGFNDVLIAKNSGSSISAGGGADTIVLGLGNDTVNAGSGNDIIDGPLSGNDTVTGGSGKQIYDLGISNHNFNLTVTDFHPLIWQSQPPSESQAIADPQHDYFAVNFLPESGVTTQAQADAAFQLSMGQDGQMHPFQISGHDVIFTVQTADVEGTITFKGAADLIPDAQHNFTIFDHVSTGGVN